MHGHHHALWEKLLDAVPTTRAEVRYGTPEMAIEVKRLVDETELLEAHLFVTAGHRDGIFSFGKDFEEALGAILNVI